MGIRSTSALAALLLLAAIDAGSQTAVQPGDYITESGWGHLSIKRGRAGALIFSIEASGANGHVCGLEGEIRNGKATLDEAGKDHPCIVGFTPKDGGIAVTIATAEACRYFCGARASFDALYLTPAPGCAPAALRRTRQVFKQLYDKKSYADARATLQPALARCAKTLDWLDAGMMRNDLAITLYHLGDLAACRQTLEPLAKDAARSDDDVREAFPPADAESYLPIVKAARTNLQRCKGR